ncbi:MAG: hypothetical protein CSA49_00775 [Gammaproteobacteria bacterium]|nr:MAG: hypothetical protein CSA49_00775 [Gammaproteobacteria bacterium]
MQLFVILAALVAVNLGLVYVGTENYEGDPEKQPEGIVEIEEVANDIPGSSETAPTADENKQTQ